MESCCWILSQIIAILCLTPPKAPQLTCKPKSLPSPQKAVYPAPLRPYTQFLGLPTPLHPRGFLEQTRYVPASGPLHRPAPSSWKILPSALYKTNSLFFMTCSCPLMYNCNQQPFALLFAKPSFLTTTLSVAVFTSQNVSSRSPGTLVYPSSLSLSVSRPWSPFLPLSWLSLPE